MSDPLHEAVERLANPDPGKLTWWEIALLPVGLILLAGYAVVSWIATLFTRRTRAGAGRCIVPLIQGNPELAQSIREFTDSICTD